MLQLVTPATEAIGFARRHMPGLNEFLYEDATDFVGRASKGRMFGTADDYDGRVSALTSVAIGFLRGEIVALSDRRTATELLASAPCAMVGNPVWDKTIQMVGKSPASPVALSVAMEYVAELIGEGGPTDLPSVMHAAFAAYGAVMGYERGMARVEEGKSLPLPLDETATFMATVERLLETARRASAETMGHYEKAIGILYGDDEEGLARFARVLTRSVATYATNAVLSRIRKGHLACPEGLVVGRIRSYAFQNARGMLDGMTGSVDTGSLVRVMFDDELGNGLLLGSLPLDKAVRDAGRRICEEPMTEGMAMLATARAWDLCGRYGDDGTGPADFAPTGESVMGIPVSVCVDADERIAIAAVAYASGVRQAFESGRAVPSGRSGKVQDAIGEGDAEGWDASWDIGESATLRGWDAVSAAHPMAQGGDGEGVSDEAVMPVVASSGTDGTVLDPAEIRRGFRLV